jgi:hypothetical protein
MPLGLVFVEIITGQHLYVHRSLEEPFTLWSGGSINNSFRTNLASPFGSYEWIVRSIGGTECALDGPLWRFSATELRAGDSDRDGLPDDWERQTACTLMVMNGSTDRDKDGLLDWQERVAGTDPFSPDNDFGLMRLRKVPVKYAALGYPIGIAMDWMSVAGREYSIHYAVELQDQAMVWWPFEQVQGTGGLVSVTNFFPDPMDFYRLSVTLPASP